jgi:hypothetical protein
MGPNLRIKESWWWISIGAYSEALFRATVKA